MEHTRSPGRHILASHSSPHYGMIATQASGSGQKDAFRNVWRRHLLNAVRWALRMIRSSARRASRPLLVVEVSEGRGDVECSIIYDLSRHQTSHHLVSKLGKGNATTLATSWSECALNHLCQQPYQIGVGASRHRKCRSHRMREQSLGPVPSHFACHDNRYPIDWPVKGKHSISIRNLGLHLRQGLRATIVALWHAPSHP